MRSAALLLLLLASGARAAPVSPPPAGTANIPAASTASAQAPDDSGAVAVKLLERAVVAPRFEVRALAASTWGQIGNPAARPLLSRALKDRNVYVRIEAATALQKLGFADEAFAALKGIIAGPTRPPKNAAEEMRNLARDKARVLAIERLSDFGGEDAVTFFETTLKDPSDAVREATAVALAKMGLDEFSRQFQEAMRSKDEGVRVSAARSLGLIGGAQVPAALRDAADDKSVAVRAEAMRAMTNFTSPDAAAILVHGLADADDRVRARALASLSQLSDPSSKELLERVLKDKPTAETALKAMAGLARRGEKIEYDVVNDALHEKDADLRALGFDVLRAVDDDGALPLLSAVMLKDADPSLRVQAAGLILRRMQRRRTP